MSGARRALLKRGGQSVERESKCKAAINAGKHARVFLRHWVTQAAIERAQPRRIGSGVQDDCKCFRPYPWRPRDLQCAIRSDAGTPSVVAPHGRAERLELERETGETRFYRRQHNLLRWFEFISSLGTPEL
jgi:hypothetical protein